MKPPAVPEDHPIRVYVAERLERAMNVTFLSAQVDPSPDDFATLVGVALRMAGSPRTAALMSRALSLSDTT